MCEVKRRWVEREQEESFSENTRNSFREWRQNIFPKLNLNNFWLIGYNLCSMWRWRRSYWLAKLEQKFIADWFLPPIVEIKCGANDRWKFPGIPATKKQSQELNQRIFQSSASLSEFRSDFLFDVIKIPLWFQADDERESTCRMRISRLDVDNMGHDVRSLQKWWSDRHEWEISTR